MLEVARAQAILQQGSRPLTAEFLRAQTSLVQGPSSIAFVPQVLQPIWIVHREAMRPLATAFRSYLHAPNL